MITRIVFLLPLICLVCVPTSAEVVLSEIMFNAPQNEDYEEYVELYNPSTTDWVDLTGLRLGDAQEQDSLLPHSGSLFLQPQNYALILDPGYWSHSTIYDTLIPANALILTLANSDFGSNGLNNSNAEPIILLSSSGDTVAYFVYTPNNADGYSEEKIRLIGGDYPGNWNNSLTYLGTPGFTNTLQPADTDLAVTLLQAQPSPLPLNASVSLTAQLSNVGLTTTSSGQLIFELGEIESSVPTSMIAFTAFPALNPGLAVNLTINLPSLTPGSHRLWAWHDLDDDYPQNDTLSQLLLGGYPDNSLIINEIMAIPPANGGEWMELYNPSAAPINLIGCSFTDADTVERVILTSSSLVVNSHQYVLIAQDSGLVGSYDPEEVALIVLGSDWLILNNDGDTPAVLDAAAFIQDAVPYSNWEIPEDVSLERVSSQGSSADPANWRPSSDPSGGTPGRVNSAQIVTPVGTIGALSFTPDPFDPDQHGLLQITLIPPDNASSATVIAYDLGGRKLKVIYNGTGVQGQIQTVWDGHDSSGRRLPPGLYLLFAEFCDGVGNRQSSLKKTLVIAGRL